MITMDTLLKTFGSQVVTDTSIVYGLLPPSVDKNTPSRFISLRLGRDSDRKEDDFKQVSFMGSSSPLYFTIITITCRAASYEDAQADSIAVWTSIGSKLTVENMGATSVGMFKYVGRDENKLHLFKGYYKIILK